MPIKKGVIIVVHGIGLNQPNWAREEDNAMANVLRRERQRYPSVFPDDAAYDETIEVVGIACDSIFETVRAHGEELGNELTPDRLGNASATRIGYVGENLGG